MVRIVLERVYETPFPTPMTIERWSNLKQNKLLDECFVMHGVQWIQTLAACDGHWAVCEMEAPEAEVVRIACRSVNEPFRGVWRVYCQGNPTPTIESADAGSVCIVLENIWEPPINETGLQATLEQVAPYLEKHHVRWQRSLVLVDGSRTLSTFRAPSTTAVEQAYQQAGLAFERLYPVDQLLSND